MSIPQKIRAKINRESKYPHCGIDHILGINKKISVCITFDSGFVNNYKHVSGKSIYIVYKSINRYYNPAI